MASLVLMRQFLYVSGPGMAGSLMVSASFTFDVSHLLPGPSAHGPSAGMLHKNWIGFDDPLELSKRYFILMTRRLYSHIAAVTDESDPLVDLCPDGTRPEDAPEVTLVVNLHAHDRRHRLRGQNDGQNGVAGREDGCPQDPAYPRTCSTWQCHGVRSIETSGCCGGVQAPLAAVIVAVDFDLRFCQPLQAFDGVGQVPVSLDT